jgi:cytidylate kinase
VERRIRHIQEYLNLGRREAEEYVRKTDQRRKRYVKRYYGANVDDPLMYHVIINTDRVAYAEAAGMLADVVSRDAGPDLR